MNDIEALELLLNYIASEDRVTILVCVGTSESWGELHLQSALSASDGYVAVESAQRVADSIQMPIKFSVRRIEP